MIENKRNEWDVVVIGAGPSGTTAAALLAQKGYRVLTLEKEVFPRYHIGESLIPYCWFTLNRLGMVKPLNDAGFVKKHSVQFVNEDGRLAAPFYFSKHMDHPAAQSWQVTRATFDQMMVENAEGKGAEIRQGVKVTQVLRDRAQKVCGVETQNAEGEVEQHQARMVIDASGRDALHMARSKWRVPDAELKKIAMWTYYRGAKRDSGIDEGATTVAYVNGKQWFWYIPLADDLVSVGITGDRDYLFRDGRDLQTIFDREIQHNAWIADHLSQGKQEGEVYVTGDYSYRSRYCAEDNMVLVGDAFAFLDPVFSSGVFLALKTGEYAADAVAEALAANDTSAGRFAEFGKKTRAGIEAMRKLVYGFYDDSFSFAAVLKKNPELQGDLTDCLIGHVERDYTELFAAVAEFAEVPEALEHGSPLETTS